MRTLALLVVGLFFAAPARASGGAAPDPTPMAPADFSSFWGGEFGVAPAVVAFGGTGDGQTEFAGELHVEFSARVRPHFAFVFAPDMAVSAAPKGGWVFVYLGLGVRFHEVLPVDVSFGLGPTGYFTPTTNTDEENGVAIFLHVSKRLTGALALQGGVVAAPFGSPGPGVPSRTILSASVGVSWLAF